MDIDVRARWTEIDRIVDNTDGGYVENGDGWINSGAGYERRNGLLPLARQTSGAGEGNNTATWTFSGLGQDNYEVFITWTASTPVPAHAQYQGRKPIFFNNLQKRTSALSGWHAKAIVDGVEQVRPGLPSSMTSSRRSRGMPPSCGKC